MTVKTAFTANDFSSILSQYNVGAYVQSEPIQQGTVQTNYLLQTDLKKVVFRYYESRSEGSVLFESDLLVYLTNQLYPCPKQIQNSRGSYLGSYQNKPYLLFEFIEGQSIEFPTSYQWNQVIQKAAELQKLSQNFHSGYTKHRWNYDAALCKELAHQTAVEINNKNAWEKFQWLEDELESLILPPSLPKGICHCDFHYSNMLFQVDQLVLVLDFDDANITYLQFDLIGLIEHHAWSNNLKKPDFPKARWVVNEYLKHRPLSAVEREYFFDVYKLSILFDCLWYFDRGDPKDFRERRKIDVLKSWGRNEFIDQLFG